MNKISFGSLPGSVAIVKEDMLTIGSIDNFQKLYISSVPLGEHPYCIFHQEESRTFPICSEMYNYNQRNNKVRETVQNFVCLLDDQTFNNVSTYALDADEHGRSILSFSFTDDNNVYCCVGTTYVYSDKDEPHKVRILVFSVEDGQLQLVSEKETKGVVFNLNLFNGKLLVGINGKIVLYIWMLYDDGS